MVASEEELSVLAVELSSDFAHDETSTAMLTTGTNQYNKIFISFLFRNVDNAELNNHKFKLFNPIDILTKLNINLPDSF